MTPWSVHNFQTIRELLTMLYANDILLDYEFKMHVLYCNMPFSTLGPTVGFKLISLCNTLIMDGQVHSSNEKK